MEPLHRRKNNQHQSIPGDRVITQTLADCSSNWRNYSNDNGGIHRDSFFQYSTSSSLELRCLDQGECGPVCGTHKRRMDFGTRDDDLFYSGGGDSYSSYTNNGTLEDVVTKRLKRNENRKINDGEVCSFGGVSSLNLLSNYDRLPRLEQFPENFVSSIEGCNDYIVNGDKRRLEFQMRDDYLSGTLADVVLHCKRLKKDKSQKIDDKVEDQTVITGMVKDDIMNSSGSVDISSKDPSNDHCEKGIQDDSEANPAKLDANCSAISTPTAASNDSELGFDETKIKGGSLAEVLTALNCEASSSDGQNTCQLCAKEKFVFGPPPLYCSSCEIRIQRNAIYHSSLDEMGARLSICTKCFKGSRGRIIKFRGLSVSKTSLHKEKNNKEKEDLWVQCDRCQNWQHRVCGLYNDKSDTEGKAEYFCPKCCLDKMQSGGPDTTFGAKNLPTSKLSDHLEKRLFKRLEQEREEMASYLGKNLDEIEVAEDLVIRVVGCVDKHLKVKKEFLDIFHEEDYPSEFEYRSKVIFLFQKIEGVDVCLFGMCVQEFGSECRGPNNRCIYISYLDSVKYFKPERTTVTGESLRTFVYHEILVGYLDYCKKRGFNTCYLWSCPLAKGEDYIFYCHPETQKTPDQCKLRVWYKSMLKKAVKDGVVLDCTNLYDCFFVPTYSNKITAARLPYFEGDYWSGAAEELVRNIEQESGRGLKQRKLPTKRTLKDMGHNNSSTDATKDVLVMQKLGQTIFSYKENFMIVRLHNTCNHCHEVIASGSGRFCNHCKKVQLSDCNENILTEVLVNDVPLHTKDEDFVLENSFFETREAFLDHCQKDNYQFDTLSHAKYSSMMILYNFTHNPNTRASTIDVCNRNVLERKKNELVAKLDSILDVLKHASKCERKTCPNTKCGQLRRLFHHCNLCKVRVRGDCKNCKKVWLILSEHSKICRDSDCKVPRCMDIKIKLQKSTARSCTSKSTNPS